MPSNSINTPSRNNNNNTSNNKAQRQQNDNQHHHKKNDSSVAKKSKHPHALRIGDMIPNNVLSQSQQQQQQQQQQQRKPKPVHAIVKKQAPAKPPQLDMDNFPRLGGTPSIPVSSSSSSSSSFNRKTTLLTSNASTSAVPKTAAAAVKLEPKTVLVNAKRQHHSTLSPPTTTSITPMAPSFTATTNTNTNNTNTNTNTQGRSQHATAWKHNNNNNNNNNNKKQKQAKGTSSAKLPSQRSSSTASNLVHQQPHHQQQYSNKPSIAPALQQRQTTTNTPNTNTLPSKKFNTVPTATTTTSTTTNTNGDEHVLFRLMQERNVYQRKGKQRLNSRKKNLSALKKKVLQERLQKWYQLHPELKPNKQQSSPSQLTHSTTNANTTVVTVNSPVEMSTKQQYHSTDDASPSTFSCSICIYNFVTPNNDHNDDDDDEEVNGEYFFQDEDEYMELVENLTSMANKIGPVVEVYIPRNDNNKINTTILPNPPPKRMKQDYPAFVRFQYPHHASAAEACWQNLVIGGEMLRVIKLPIKEVKQEEEEKQEEKEGTTTTTTTTTTATATTAINDWKSQVVLVELAEYTRIQSGGPSDSTDKDNNSSSGGNNNTARTAIVIPGILTEDDYDDDDCLQESLADVRTIASQYGPLVNIAPGTPNDGSIWLTYSMGEKEAENVATKLSSATLAGRQLVARIVQTKHQSAPEEHTPSNVGSTTTATTVLLENILNEDDLRDTDCLNETLGDIRELAETYGSIVNVSVVATTVKLSYAGPPSIAESAAMALNGLVMGGTTVTASIAKVEDSEASSSHQLYLQNLLSADDLEDEECLEESLADVRTMALNFGQVRNVSVVPSNVVCVEFDENIQAENLQAALSKFDGMVTGGMVVKATLAFPSTLNPTAQPFHMQLPGDEQAVDTVPETNTTMSATTAMTTPTPTAGVTPATKAEPPPPMFSGDKRIPETFARAKRVPKIPNTGVPREYAKSSNNETVRPLLTEMLGELLRLQKKAVVEGNTKVKRRVVMGLREVARGIRSHKVKMVVMANNLDEYDAIDNKLQEIVELAKNENVPIFFEFTKRTLGKAVGKNIKVAVVGIQNAEGAHPQFKKLNAIAAKL